MVFSDSRRQIPHAFAFGGRSASSSSRKPAYPSVNTCSPQPPATPASPPSPRSSLDQEDPTSPLTPLWGMGSFVTSSSFSRSPVSITSSNEIGPPRLGSFDWDRAGPSQSMSIEFPLKEVVSCAVCCVSRAPIDSFSKALLLLFFS